jgi:hypothetical protein
MLLSFETGELLLNTDVRFDMPNWSANLKEARLFDFYRCTSGK